MIKKCLVVLLLIVAGCKERKQIHVMPRFQLFQEVCTKIGHKKGIIVRKSALAFDVPADPMKPEMLYLKILNPTISETNLFIELELQEGEVKDC